MILKFWHDGNEAELRTLWQTNLKTREIGDILGTTKNAVCSKARQMCLPNRRPTKEQYQEKLRQHKKPSRTEIEKARKCLMCQDEFVSAGIGQRICPTCKNTHAWRSGRGCLDVWMGN